MSLEERISQGWEKAKDAVPLDGEEVPPVDAPPVDPEAPPVEAPAVDPEAPPVDPNAPPAEAVPATEFEWDEGDVGDPGAFFAEVKKDAATQKFFDEHPQLKNAVGGALRRDKENREIRSYIPDVDTAKLVSQAATAFQNIDNHFLGATTPEGANAFLDHWVREAMELDDKGQPVMENGQYKLHPALPYILDHIGSNKLQVWGAEIAKTGQVPAQFAPIVDALHKFAVTKGDDRLEAAAAVLKEVLAPSSSGAEEVPDALKPFAEKLQAERAELDKTKRADADRQQREQQTAHLQSIERAESKAADSMKAQLKPRFASSGLTEFEQAAAFKEIGEQLDSALGTINADGSWTKGTHPSSPMFQSIYDSINQNNAPGEEREKKLAKHLMTYTQQILGPIAAPVIRAAKQGTLDRTAEKKTTVDSQKRASASDPRGTSIAPSSPQPQSPAQMRSQIIDEYKKAHGGEEPEMSYVMGEAFKRSNAPKR